MSLRGELDSNQRMAFAITTLAGSHHQPLGHRRKVPPVGIEPTSSGFSDQCSDLVSYRGKKLLDFNLE